MVRILIAHPSKLVCDSLRSILDKEDHVCITGCASSIEEFNFLLPHANMILLAVELGRESIFEILHNVHLTHPHVKVLIVGVEDNPQTILRYIEAGAAGWISPNESMEDIVRKVIATNEKKAYVSPTVAALMIERIAQLSRQPSRGLFDEEKFGLVDALTPRECEVLDLIGDGCTNRDIAQELYIECGTVKNHVHNILRKLEVNSRHEAVALYQNVDYGLRPLAA